MNPDPNPFPLPLLGFAAFSGTGKTTLLTQLLPLLKNQGLRVAVVKHSHHKFDIDQPGKDSYRLREAGAEQIVIASPHRLAWIRDLPTGRAEPNLAEALAALDCTHLDLVLVEGFKHAAIAKIELYRSSLGKPLLYPEDRNIIAIATDANCEFDAIDGLTHLNLDDPAQIAAFIAAGIRTRAWASPALTAN